ncbi:MAG TPA: hypothetical protein VFB06_03420 [Streptosporangiaceae bacterium]|nr:hypothetical protein [Streptosporangiaceae bacterium]
MTAPSMGMAPRAAVIGMEGAANAIRTRVRMATPPALVAPADRPLPRARIAVG